MTICAIYLANPIPPFGLIRQIKTATDVDRIKPLRQPGRLSFRMSSSEGLCDNGLITGMESGSPLAADTIREGAAIIDYSTEGIPPWLWYIRRMKFDVDSGYVVVECAEWRQLINDRQVPLVTPVGSGGAPAIAALLLEQVNARNPTHIISHKQWAALHLLPRTAVQLGGMMLGQAFNEMAKRTDSEWWIDYGGGASGWSSSSRRMNPRLQWAYRRGGDKTNDVQITEGVHLSGVTYARDAREIPRIMRYIQGGGVNPGDAPAGAVGTKKGATKARSTNPGYFEDDSPPRPTKTGGVRSGLRGKEPGRRGIDKQWGPGLEMETLRVLPQGADDQAMLTAAFHGAELPVVALQSVELTIRNPRPVMDVAGVDFASPTPLWGRFFLGDIINVRLDTPRFYAGVEINVRITAMQPDEAAGELIVVAEVQ